MRYIRRKDNHNIIKSYGRVDKGGLGEFDPEVYEEVEGRPPERFIQEKKGSELTIDDIITKMQELQAMIDAIQGGQK